MVKRKLYKVGTICKGKFRSKMQSGTGFVSKKSAVKAQKFFQSLNKKKKVIIRKI